MSAYLKFIGKDKGSIPGIPARDLTHKEAQDIGVAHLLQSGLYELVEKPETKQEPPAQAETQAEKPKRTTKRRKE